MRVPSGKIPYQPLTFLWERHNEIARRLVAGERPKDICQAMTISSSRLSIIMASPAFQERLRQLSVRADDEAADIQGRISKLAIDGMTVLEEAIRGVNGRPVEGISPKVRTDLARDVLDRAGYSAVQKSASVSATLTAEDIEVMKKRARTPKKTFEGVIDLHPIAETPGVSG